MSASKGRQVLDLIRDHEVGRAAELLRTTERSAAAVIGRVLASAVANAVHNDGQDPEDLYVSACFADEGETLKRWRPRARGRATRIRKRSCHITVIVDRLPDDRLARRRAQRDAMSAGRSRRVAESRRRADLSGRLSRRRAARDRAAEEAAEKEAEAAVAEAAAAEAEAVEAEAAASAAAKAAAVAPPVGEASSEVREEPGVDEGPAPASEGPAPAGEGPAPAGEGPAPAGDEEGK
jgi:large subunit ribosomal protein L22